MAKNRVSIPAVTNMLHNILYGGKPFKHDPFKHDSQLLFNLYAKFRCDEEVALVASAVLKEGLNETSSDNRSRE